MVTSVKPLIQLALPTFGAPMFQRDLVELGHAVCLSRYEELGYSVVEGRKEIIPGCHLHVCFFCHFRGSVGKPVDRKVVFEEFGGTEVVLFNIFPPLIACLEG
jgi:hypothetical protein